MSTRTMSESTTIHRSQQAVWDTLTSAEHWGTWYGVGLSGVSPGWEEGATMTYVSGEKPVISRISPPELLQWGEGTAIRLAAIDATTTEITYSQTVGGIFAQDPMLLAEYENMFTTEASSMLQELKRLVESQEPEPPPEVAEPPPAAPVPATVEPEAAPLDAEPVANGLVEDRPLEAAPAALTSELADATPAAPVPATVEPEAAPLDAEPVADRPLETAPVVEAAPAPAVAEPAPDAAPARHLGPSRILDSSVIVYREASESSPRLAECYTGDRVRFGAATEKEGKIWVGVTLADGRQGYLPGSTRHFPAERAFACLPVSGDTVSATFPDLCAYCAQPADTELEVVYDESPKKGTRPPGALLAKLQVPYCARHARESRRNRRAVGASVLAALLLAALAALAIGIGIGQRGIFGFESGEMVFLAAIVGFCGTAYATFRLVMLLAKKLLPRLFPSMADMGRGQLGIWSARAPGDDVLVLQFHNAEFARRFRELNPYDYRSLMPEPVTAAPAAEQGIAAAPPKPKTAAAAPADRKGPRRGLLIAGGLVALLVTVGCVSALVTMGSVLTGPGKSASVEVTPTQVNREQVVAAVPTPTPEPATPVQVEREPTASPVPVAPQPTDSPEPTVSPAPTRTPRPANTAAPGGAGLAGPDTLEADGPVLDLAFSPDGAILASAGERGTLQFWDVATGRVLRTVDGHPGGAFSLAFSPDGGTLASGGDDDLIRVWDPATGTLLQTLEGHDLWINSVAYSPDGSFIASGSADRTVKLWDGATGQVLQTLEGHTDWVRSLAFSPGGDLLASGSCAMVDAEKTSLCLIGEIILWDTATGERSKAFNNQMGWVYSLAFSPDGQLLASGAGDETITLWNVAERQPVTTLEYHRGRVNSLAFSPDGTLLVSGCDDKNVRLWSVATGELAKALRGHDSWVNSVVFTPDGQAIASGSSDATIRLWDAATEP